MAGRRKQTRPEVLENAPMRFAPENEQGVVYLFHQYAKKHRIKVEEIRAGFPDCIAYKRIGGREKKIRIEFEYKSRSFKSHKHSTKGCDWIVCWEHNWPGVPRHLKVIELRQEYGLGFNVWIMPVNHPYKDVISRIRSDSAWSLPSQAHCNDLVLFYLTRPDSCIRDIFAITGDVRHKVAGWRPGMDYMGPIRRVCTLKSPLYLSDLRSSRHVQTAGFVRGTMQGRIKATEYWPYLYDMIVGRNPSLKRKLAKFIAD